MSLSQYVHICVLMLKIQDIALRVSSMNCLQSNPSSMNLLIKSWVAIVVL